MIKNIISYFFLFDLILAMLISFVINFSDLEVVDMGSFFLAYIRSCSNDVNQIHFQIPNIPNIDLDYLNKTEFMKALVVSNFSFAKTILLMTQFLNTLINVINFFIAIINVLIKLLTFIFVFIRNLYTMRDSIVNAQVLIV